MFQVTPDQMARNMRIVQAIKTLGGHRKCAEVAREFNLTRERVRQIWNFYKDRKGWARKVPLEEA